MDDLLAIKRAKQAAYARAWRERNPEKVKAYQHRHYQKHRARKLQKHREYCAKNRPKLNARMREWRRKNVDHCRAYVRRRMRLNVNGCRDTKLRWNANNKHKSVIYDRKRYARLRRDLSYRIKASMRSRINRFIRGGKLKAGSTVKLLGCSMADFKIYIESKFEPGMSWENHGLGKGKWHVDHIMPCAIFDLTKPEHQKRCFHFSNLQPLWWIENLLKKDKVLTNQFQLI